MLSADEAEDLLRYFPSVEFAFAYGSGVVEQGGYKYEQSDPSKLPMMDFILVVENSEQWHEANMLQNPSHYTSIIPLGSKYVAQFQDKIPARLWFNAYIPMKSKGCVGRLMKYGVINKEYMLEDLNTWSNLYTAGRLQKPVRVLKHNAEIEEAINNNLESAVRTSLLMLPEKFEEIDQNVGIIIEEAKEENPLLEMLRNVEEAKREMDKGTDDLEEIKRRVHMTKNTMDTHMNTISTVKNSLLREGVVQRRKKIGGYRRGEGYSKSTPKLPNIPKKKKKREERETNPMFKFERDSLGNIIYSSSSGITKPQGLNKKEKDQYQENREKGKIMNKLINMTGRMNEFTESLERELKIIQKNGSKGLQSKLNSLNGTAKKGGYKI